MMDTYLSRIAVRAAVAGPVSAMPDGTAMSPAANDPASVGAASDAATFFTDARMPVDPLAERPADSGTHTRALVPGSLPGTDVVSAQAGQGKADRLSPSASAEMPYITRHVDRLVFAGAEGSSATDLSPSAGRSRDAAAGGNFFHPPVTGQAETRMTTPSPGNHAEPFLPMPADRGERQASQSVMPMRELTDKNKLKETSLGSIPPLVLPGNRAGMQALIPAVRMQPSEPPAAMHAPQSKKENPAPSLVIGKITVEIMAPLKPAPPRIIRRVAPPAPASSSSHKPSFGLGQL